MLFYSIIIKQQQQLVKRETNKWEILITELWPSRQLSVCLKKRKKQLNLKFCKITHCPSMCCTSFLPSLVVLFSRHNLLWCDEASSRLWIIDQRCMKGSPHMSQTVCDFHFAADLLERRFPELFVVVLLPSAATKVFCRRDTSRYTEQADAAIFQRGEGEVCARGCVTSGHGHAVECVCQG